MTDQSAPEPTMEEILASIRRIISEDDAPADGAGESPASADPQVEPEAEPAPAAFMDPTPSTEPEAETEDEVLDLTDRYDAPATETIGDLDVSDADLPEPPAAPPVYDSLVGDSAAASAASAFAGLAASFQKPEPKPKAEGPQMTFASGTSVEGMVADMLRPMLKDWLDANLPRIVEAQVRKEVERIARDAG